MLQPDFINYTSQPNFLWTITSNCFRGASLTWDFWLSCLIYLHRDASDQKFRRKDGIAVNQLMKAIAVAVSNCMQWFCLQLSRSLSIRTVMPAEAQAAAKVSVDVICRREKNS